VTGEESGRTKNLWQPLGLALVLALLLVAGGVTVARKVASNVACPSLDWATAAASEVARLVPPGSTDELSSTADCDDRRAVSVSFSTSLSDDIAAQTIDSLARKNGWTLFNSVPGDCYEKQVAGETTSVGFYTNPGTGLGVIQQPC
jgi:hypothetical protein